MVVIRSDRDFIGDEKLASFVEYLYRRWRKEQSMPTLREMMAEYGFSSTSTASYWVQKAVNLGLLETVPGKARAIKMTRKGHQYRKMYGQG